MNNAVYVQFLEQATDEAFASFGMALDAAWQMRRLAIEYLAPALPRDELEMEAWVSAVRDDGVAMGYALGRPLDGATIVRAEVDWQGGEGAALGVLRYAKPPNQPALKPFDLAPDFGGRSYRWRHRVRPYELGMRGYASYASYFQWLEHAVFRAGELKGWTRARMREENLLILQRRHDAQFFSPAHYEDEVEIVSRIVELRRVRGRWLHEMFNTESGALLLRDYSEGAFVDWQARLRAPPAAMIEDLSQGE